MALAQASKSRCVVARHQSSERDGSVQSGAHSSGEDEVVKMAEQIKSQVCADSSPFVNGRFDPLRHRLGSAVRRDVRISRIHSIVQPKRLRIR